MTPPNIDLSRLVMGSLVLIGFAVAVWAVLYYPIKPEVKDIVLIFVGALISAYKDVINFFFSSSAGSAAKDQTIASLAKGT